MPPLLVSLRLFLLALLAHALPATWSIILIDTRTGEIAIASATCVSGFDLQLGACVVVVGRGAAAAQSFVDDTGQNRSLIFAQLQAGTSPLQILALLAAQDATHQTRQYGIVDTQGRAIGFSGVGAGAWAGHVTGQIGTIAYAVQGNVLTGAAVVNDAVLAIHNTPGDLADKIMAAMEASRLMGGDGRCSCSFASPTGCGVPPASFTKTAHIGYVLIARPGDSDGVCNAGFGCANGSYYLNLNVANASSPDPDPVLTLRTRFLNWRLSQILRPDHFRSTVAVDPQGLLDDGQTTGRLRITVRDWRGAQVPFGGASIQVQPETGAPAIAVGTVTDHGDGTYTVPIGPATVAGVARLRVTVNDGLGPVRLAPSVEVPVRSDALWLSTSGIDAYQGSFDAVLHRGPAFAGRGYLLLATLSGTAPGVALGPGLTLPLVPDALTHVLLDIAMQGSPLLAALDGQGRAVVPFASPPGVLSSFRGGRMDFAFLSVLPIDFASNPAPLELR